MMSALRAWEIETHFSGGPAVTAREARRFFWDYIICLGFWDFIAFETYCMVVSVIFYNVTGTVQIVNHNFVKIV